MTVKDPLLYYVDADLSSTTANGPLLGMSVNGGTPSPFTTEKTDKAIHTLLADRDLIIAGGYVIWSLPLAGDVAFKSVDGSPQYAPQVRANGAYLFGLWSLTGAHITRIPRAGGNSDIAVSDPLNEWIDYDVDESTIFILSKTIVSTAPVTGGSAIPIAAAEGGEVFTQILVADVDRLAIASQTRLALVTKAGGAVTTLVPNSTYGVVSDGTSLFYFRANPGGGTMCSTGSSLYQVRLDGGPTRRLAMEPAPCVSNVIQDATSVYWLPGGAQSIHKINK